MCSHHKILKIFILFLLSSTFCAKFFRYNETDEYAVSKAFIDVVDVFLIKQKIDFNIMTIDRMN